jgi:hypothetical protein
LAYVFLSAIERIWSRVDLEDSVVRNTFKEQVLENVPTASNQRLEALKLINSKERIKSKGFMDCLKRPFKRKGRRFRLFASGLAKTKESLDVSKFI